MFKRIAVLVVLVSGIQASAECTGSCLDWDDKDAPQANAWMSEQWREEMLVMLGNESSTAIDFFFYANGNLGGLSGVFEIEGTTSVAVLGWVESHREIFGIQNDPLLTLSIAGEPRAHLATNDDEDGVLGTDYLVQLHYDGVPMFGRFVRVTTNTGGNYIRGIYNSHRPVTIGGLSQGIDNKDAISFSESAAGDTFSDTDAELIVADLGESLLASPTTALLYWRVVGIDSLGSRRVAYVNADTGVIEYLNNSRDEFSVATTHKAYGDGSGSWAGYGATIYTQSSAGITTYACSTQSNCTPIAKAQSHEDNLVSVGLGYTHALSELIPMTLSHWYNHSSTGLTPTVPLTHVGFTCAGPDCFRLGTPVLNNDNNSITVITANDRFDSSGNPKNYSTIAYRQGNVIAFANRKNQVDIVGHEYGHAIQQKLRRLSPREDAPFSFSYNEAMMDAHGEITQGIGARNELGWLGTNDWQLNGSALWECPSGLDPDTYCSVPLNYATTQAAFIWTNSTFDCTNTTGQRRAAGRALYLAWSNLVTNMGSTAAGADYDFYFAGWATNVLRTHYATPWDFPRLSDFYAATVADSDSQAIVLRFQNWTKNGLETIRSSPRGQACFQ